MPGKTRWAVAGTGSIAARTLPDLALTENVEVIAVSSRTQQRADTFASEFGIPRAYGAYQAMLADPDVNVVYICTPHGAHFAMTAQAIRAGKHVLCEKAFTVNAAQARQLAALARERNVFLMEAMWMKFNPTVQRLREIVGAGTIGAVRHITAAMGFRCLPHPPGSGVRKQRRRFTRPRRVRDHLRRDVPRRGRRGDRQLGSRPHPRGRGRYPRPRDARRRRGRRTARDLH